MPRKLTDADRNVISQAVRHAKLVAASRIPARIVRHVDPSSEILATRKTYEKDLSKWLRHFGHEAFFSPWSDDHKKILKKIERAMNKGGLFAVAMPRGGGKSTILKWATLYVMLTGRRKYVVIVAAKADMAQNIVEFVRQQITGNDLLHEYYPQVTTYARATDGKAIKARYQLRADGKTSGIEWSKNTLVLPEVLSPERESYSSNGAILQGHGLTGAIRGKWKDTKTGKVLRPDFVILDDPQTRESAESDSQCNMRERIIKGDVLGLAGPKKKIAAIMPCTIIRKGDLADRFLDHNLHPEWQGETCKLVNKWPKEQEGLWKEYVDLYKSESSEGRGFVGATEFYKKNRAKMDEGSAVSWEHRVRDGEISALQTAENLLIESGLQFWAEYQNEPIEEGAGDMPYRLTPEIVQSRVAEREPFAVPEWVRYIVASTDLNPSYALTNVVVGFGSDQTAAVLWYGLYTGIPLPIHGNSKTRLDYNAQIYEALVACGKHLRSLPFRYNVWAFDAGGDSFDGALRFAPMASQLTGIMGNNVIFLPATGIPFKSYKPLGKTVYGKRIGEKCHWAIDNQQPPRHWFKWHSDYWREVAQRAWLGSVGSPGSVSLFRGNHNEFATQICREQLKGKGNLGGDVIWNWHTRPGAHDYADCMSQAYAAAAWGGVGTGGAVNRSKRMETRKCKVQIQP